MNEKTDFGFEQVSPEEKTRRVRGVFESVATKYDLMNDLMSGGLHRLWKAFTVERSGLREGGRALDIAGGSGDLACLLAFVHGLETEMGRLAHARFAPAASRRLRYAVHMASLFAPSS